MLKEAKGDLQGAFESSATAVKLAPDNEDILSLHREIEACLRTQQEEKELSELNESQKTVLTFVDKFVVVVKEQIEPEFESSSFAKLLPATKELLRTFKVQSASCQVHLQVYFRLSKALELLCTMVMRGTTNLVGVDINNDQIDYFLELLRSMIFEQKPSIEVVVRMGTANYLIDALPSTPSAARAYFMLRILMLCGLDPQSNASIKISLLSSISFLRAVCDLMITTEISRVMSTALAFIHRVVLSAEATTALKDSSSFIATSLGGIFHKLRINTDNPNREDLIKAATESLVACSQMPLLRPFFLSPLDSRTISSSQSLAAFLAESFTLESDQVCNELAILINLTHEGESMQLEIAATGILPGLIAMIKAGDSSREKTVFLRGLILVARLSSLNSTKELLLSPSAYRSICKGFAATARYAASESETYLKDQCGHWIKLLANLSPLSPSCKEIAKEERLIQHLLLIFPTPREELGEITPVSVTLMPKGVIPSALLIGNASRCLMPLADDPALNGVLYTEKSQLGVEKLICSMATCTDMRVRKNIAILLAKGCRVPGVREKVDRLRGMQMLVELQDKF